MSSSSTSTDNAPASVGSFAGAARRLLHYGGHGGHRAYAHANSLYWVSAGIVVCTRMSLFCRLIGKEDMGHLSVLLFVPQQPASNQWERSKQDLQGFLSAVIAATTVAKLTPPSLLPLPLPLLLLHLPYNQPV